MGLCLGAARSGKDKELYGVVNNSVSTSPTTSTSSSSRSVVSAGTGAGLTKCRSIGRNQSFSDEYILGAQVGEGSLAVVYQATRKRDGEEVAVKVIQKNKLYPDEVEDVLQEVESLSILHHPNIVGLKEFAEDEENYYVVLDLVKGGELRTRITSKTVYTENEARDLFVTLVSTIQYIHSKGVVHRDLKLDNLLLAGACDVTIKIADFGVAAVVDGDDETLTKLCGTPWYIAPEILKGERYGKAVDMWSVGVILFILLGGSPPFYDRDEDALFDKIKRADYTFQPRIIWECVSDEAKDLIRGLLNPDKKKRLTAEQALQHPWIKMTRAILRSHSLVATQNELLAGSIRSGCPSVPGLSLRGHQGASMHPGMPLHGGCSIRGVAQQPMGGLLVRTTQMLDG